MPRRGGPTSRRDVLTGAVLGAAALGSGLLLPCCKKRRRTLRILHRKHFVPAFDTWFNETYVKEWGEKNDVDVVVDNIDTAELDDVAHAEIAHRKGHDLIGASWSRPMYEEHVIDHADVVQECERRYGKPLETAIRSTYNPHTKKYFGLCDVVAPDTVNWRKDLFDEAGGAPDRWDDIRRLGKKIKDKTGIPLGIGLANEVDSSMAMRAVMYAFGASEQDADGRVVLDSKETLEAVKFVKALFQEAMTPEVLSWDATSNNRAMLAEKISLAFNAVSITREAEARGLRVGDRIWLAKVPAGPVRRLSVNTVVHTYFIWSFAENIELAKKFLVDYVGRCRDDFRASRFFNLPAYPAQIPDLAALVQNDPRATPSNKYALLAGSAEWAVNMGYPGYTNAAMDDAYSSWVLTTMFAQAATGAATPEDAVRTASKRYQAIWAKWAERKLL
jgi:multiple sugar transport system substrate-binding protein